MTTRSIRIDDPSAISEARRASASAAQTAGLSDSDVARVALVATELATNLSRHARDGELLVGVSDPRGHPEIQFLAVDRGPGITDVEACLRDGYSTAGTSGTGLGAIRRAANDFDLYSTAAGTIILARVGPGRSRTPPRRVRVGGLNVPLRGETACGDNWSVQDDGTGTILSFVADGLGHGFMAAEAADMAVSLVERYHDQAPAILIETVHRGLYATRGAAVAAAAIDLAEDELVFCGIGNIAGAIIEPGRVRRMVSHAGTAGHVARKFQEFTYPMAAGAILIMHSDGLGTSWSLDRYPGLLPRDPAVIAGVLYRDFTRGRDDVSVVVVSRTAA